MGTNRAFLSTQIVLLVLLARSAALPLLEGKEPRPSSGPDRGYAAIVSRSTRAAPGWSKVVAALSRNRGAEVLEYEKSIDEVKEPLAAMMPRYACFVARPEEAGRKFVAKVHRLKKRPPILLFPHRLLNAEVIEGSELKPVIADDFILLPSPAKLEGGKTYKVVFKASRVNRV